jgi:hypothetical protein
LFLAFWVLSQYPLNYSLDETHLIPYSPTEHRSVHCKQPFLRLRPRPLYRRRRSDFQEEEEGEVQKSMAAVGDNLGDHWCFLSENGVQGRMICYWVEAAPVEVREERVGERRWPYLRSRGYYLDNRIDSSFHGPEGVEAMVNCNFFTPKTCRVSFDFLLF